MANEQRRNNSGLSEGAVPGPESGSSSARGGSEPKSTTFGDASSPTGPFPGKPDSGYPFTRGGDERASGFTLHFGNRTGPDLEIHPFEARREIEEMAREKRQTGQAAQGSKNAGGQGASETGARSQNRLFNLLPGFRSAPGSGPTSGGSTQTYHATQLELEEMKARKYLYEQSTRDIEAQEERIKFDKILETMPFYVKMSNSFVEIREKAGKSVTSRINYAKWKAWFRRGLREQVAYLLMTLFATFLATPLYVAVILIKWIEIMGDWIVFVLGIANAITAIVGTVVGSSTVQIVSAFLGMGIMIVLAIKKAFVEGVNVEAYNQKVKKANTLDADSSNAPAPAAQPEESVNEPFIKPQRYDEISGPWELGAKALSWFFVFDQAIDRKDYIDHLTNLVSASAERQSAVHRYESILLEILIRIEMSTDILDYMVNYIPGGLQGDVQILLMRMIQDWLAFRSQHLEQRMLNLIVWEREERLVLKGGEIQYKVPRKDLLMLIQTREFWRMVEQFQRVKDTDGICHILDNDKTTPEEKIRLLRTATEGISPVPFRPI